MLCSNSIGEACAIVMRRLSMQSNARSDGIYGNMMQREG